MLGEAKTQVRKEELRKQRLYPTDGITEFFQRILQHCIEHNRQREGFGAGEP
jgi:hypothetical protein